MSKPIVCEIDEKVSDDFCQNLEQSIKEKVGENSNYLLNYPAVYIHDYDDNGDHEIYIGESNDVVSRTSEHYYDRKDESKWQSKLFKDNRDLKMYVIGHKHFNKSLTLDVENKVINYMMSMENVKTVHNSKGNPQNDYYPNEEFNEIFSDVWSELRSKNKDLFLSKAKIEDSAIFKASPLHKLTIEQELAKRKILVTINNALGRNLKGQLIIVQGDAGTGKTVLTSRTFYELLQQNDEENANKIKCCLMVNHDEQKLVYDEVFKKLNVKNYDGSEIVSKPTHFINTHSKDNMVDVSFVDEGHLLLTRGKQSYRGSNQLDDIIERSKVTIVMFDGNQVLTSEQYWEPDLLEKKIELSKSQNNYIKLDNQIRIKAHKETLDWIDAITKRQVIDELHYDSSDYDIKVFDTPEQLHEAIAHKAQKDVYSLSRLIATYDWPYSSIHEKDNGQTWNVKIDNFELPWNREIARHDRQYKKQIANLADSVN